MYFLSHHSCISVFWAPALQYFKPSHPDQQLKQHGSCSQVFPSNQSLETSILCHKIVQSISLSQVERFHWDFAPQRVEIFQHQGKIWLRPTSPLGMIVFFFAAGFVWNWKCQGWIKPDNFLDQWLVFKYHICATLQYLCRRVKYIWSDMTLTVSKLGMPLCNGRR